MNAESALGVGLDGGPDGSWDLAWVGDLVGPADRISIHELPCNRWLTDDIKVLSGPQGSVVVKDVTAASVAPSDDRWQQHWVANRNTATHWSYWRRELLALTSGIASVYRRWGIAAPELLHHDQHDQRVRLVTRFLRGAPATQWQQTSYLAAALRLGRAQAGLQVGGDVDAGGGGQGADASTWLCRNYLSDYALEKPFDRDLVGDDSLWRSLERSSVPVGRLRGPLTAFVAAESGLLAAPWDGPVTLCHNDFWTRNLFSGVGEDVIAVDWAFVGVGPIGADLANTVASAGFDGFVEPPELREFGEAMFSWYLAGLREGGWTASEATARDSYLRSFVKYAWAVPALLQSAAMPERPIYVGYGDGDRMDLERVAATLLALAEWVAETQ